VSSLRTSTAPYRRLLRRVFLGSGSPETVAFQRDLLCPAETTQTRPPIFLPGQLDRITGTTGHQSVGAEIESMLAAEYTHAPTIAYHVRNAVLYRGSVYAENMRYFIADASSFQGNSDPLHYAHAALANTAVGHQFFGHWLRDDCLQFILAAKYASPLCVQIALSPHMEQYAAHFGQDWTGTSHAIVDHLVMFQDFAQNSLKRSRYEQLSSRIANLFPTQAPRDKLIYLKRGSSGKPRTIEDEDILMGTLAQKGFEVLDTMSDLTAIIRTLRSAKLVVSMEGSNINHFNFCAAPNCALVVLQPPDRFTAFHRHWTECVDVRLGFVVGEKRGQNYAFSISEILKTVDLALEAMG
jgi:hypothetical protein